MRKEISEEIAPKSKIFLSTQKTTCVTCRMVNEQFNILNEINGKGISVYFYDDRSNLDSTDKDDEFPKTWNPAKFKKEYLEWFISNKIPNYRDRLNRLWNQYKHKEKFMNIIDLFE